MKAKDDFSRQTFLGQSFDGARASLLIGIIGLGGGGSHIAQQLAHVGFLNYLLVDPQTIEASNLNRLVGGTASDVTHSLPKTLIAERMIKGIRPAAMVLQLQSDWNFSLDELKKCEVVFGCVDSYVERDRIEAFCRRYRILYIDIGMTVKAIGDDYWIVGQIIASIPGRACMKCMGFINNEKLREEADRYGEAGAEPQVVWANGLLASVAVGQLLSAVSDWNNKGIQACYLEYDGNMHIVSESHISRALKNHECKHYPINDVGDVNKT